MKTPLQITSRDFDLSKANKEDINKYVKKIENICDRIISCKVVVESLRHRSDKGKLYNVQIILTVPGSELVVKREPNEEYHLAVRDAFNAAFRKLKDFVEQQRGHVKHHEQAPLARIDRLFPDEGYGFIITYDDKEIYFHENSVLNYQFKKLKKGMEVRFVEEIGEKGAQASSVTVV